SCAGSGQAGRVRAGKGKAVCGGGAHGRVPGVGGNGGLGGAGGQGGQLAIACGQCGSYQPSCKGWVAEQEPCVRRQVGADLADVTDGGGWSVARFADLSLGQGGLGPCVQAGEM